MPNPAFSKLKQTATIVFHAGEKVVRTATPVVRKAADDVRDRIRRPDEVPGPAPAQEARDDAPVGTAPEPAADPASPVGPAAPSPASIAKNVPHQRPVVKPPATPRPKASDLPGGKLPPRR